MSSLLGICTLFEISNSDFNGVVRYTAQLDDKKKFIIDAFWCHGRGGPKYRNLKYQERYLAYGFHVKQNKLVIKSFKNELELIVDQNQIKCLLELNGKKIILSNVHITTKTNILGIKGVAKIDIYGQNYDTKQDIHGVIKM